MTSAVEQLVALVDEKDPYVYGPRELAATQLAALNERFEERRVQVQVLNRRASDQGVSQISEASDLVPLLFSHTNYKSYPESLLKKSRWDLMTLWLRSLSAVAVDNVDLNNVGDVDDWIARLHEAGHLVFASSSTTGNCSFFNQTHGDRAFRMRGNLASIRAMTGITPQKEYAVFLSGPRVGYTSVQEYQNIVVETLARQGAVHFLFEGGASVHELNRMASMRRALAMGTATARISSMQMATRQTRPKTLAGQSSVMHRGFSRIKGNPATSWVRTRCSTLSWRRCGRMVRQLGHFIPEPLYGRAVD